MYFFMFEQYFLCYSELEVITVKTLFWKNMYLGKKALLWLAYLILALYIGYLVLTSQTIGAKLIYGCMGTVVLSIVLLFEYLKASYEKMIYALTVECDLDKATKQKADLQRKDLFNGFKQSIIIFDSLLLLDKGNYQECLTHLQNHHHFFHGTWDYLFIYYHTQLSCYSFLNDEKNVRISFDHLVKLRSAQKRHLRGLYSWHEIIGLNYFYQNRNQKCLNELHLVDQHKLNNRELTYFLYLKGQCLLNLNRKSEGYRVLKEAKSIGNTLAVTHRI